MVASRPGSARDRLVRAAAAVNVTRRVAASALILIIAAESACARRTPGGPGRLKERLKELPHLPKGRIVAKLRFKRETTSVLFRSEASMTKARRSKSKTKTKRKTKTK